MQHVRFEHRQDASASAECLSDALWAHCDYKVIAKVEVDWAGWVERYYDGGSLVGAVLYNPDGAPMRAQYSGSLDVPSWFSLSSN
jgi:hypothetical protein